MPASHERVPNRPLSGAELTKIIEKDVHDILTRDGLFSSHIAFPRVAYEVRVTLHLDNPVYPEHISTVLSRPASKQQIEANPALASIETAPLSEPTSDNETVFSEERQRVIASPNMARVEHEIPIVIEKRNLDTNQIERKEQKFTGDTPDPLSVGNLTRDSNATEDQRRKWNRPKKAGKK